MKFLFDENISYRIVKKIIKEVPGSLHSSSAGLGKSASDRSIWTYARSNDYVLVTFDEDFQDLVNVYGFPPKVILLRIGNSSTRCVSETLLYKLPEILEFYHSEGYGLLEIF